MYGKYCLLSVDRSNPHITSLNIEARVTSYTDFNYLCWGDDILRILERNESKQPYYTTLINVEN